MLRIRQVGVDEVGRGPLAGPVTVAALSIPKSFPMIYFRGITDSKKLSRKKREEWSWRLHQARKEGKLDFHICSISSRVIDERGIVTAIRMAVNRSIRKLQLDSKSKIYLDGTLRAPKKFKHQQTISGGDGKNKLISAASVVAKVHRDALMRRLAIKYPKYGFDIHMGYGTLKHRRTMKKYGMTKEHRRSFVSRS